MTALEAIGSTLFALASGAVLSAVMGIIHGRQIRKLEARIEAYEAALIQLGAAAKVTMEVYRRSVPPRASCTGPLGSCTVAGGRCVHCGRAAKEARPS